MSIILAKSGFRVGSPSPEKVMEFYLYRILAACVKLRIQSLPKFVGGRQPFVLPAILVPATLTIDTIEIAQFPFRRKQVDPQ